MHFVNTGSNSWYRTQRHRTTQAISKSVTGSVTQESLHGFVSVSQPRGQSQSSPCQQHYMNRSIHNAHCRQLLSPSFKLQASKRKDEFLAPQDLRTTLIESTVASVHLATTCFNTEDRGSTFLRNVNIYT